MGTVGAQEPVDAAGPRATRGGWTRRVGALLDATTTRQRDVALAVGVGALAVLLHVGVDGAPVAAVVDLPGWVGALVLVAMSGALVWRRDDPDRTITVCGVLITVYYLTGNVGLSGVLVFVFSLYGMAAFSEHRRDGLLSLAASVFFMTLTFVLTGGPRAVVTANWALSAFVFVVAWSLGDATRTRSRLASELRARAERLEERRRGERAELVAAERRRIARELHDVVSHTVSVVVVQAGAARRVVHADPDAAAEALAAIEGTGRAAMDELRRMLGVLREGDEGVGREPAPDLRAVRALVDGVLAAGLPARLEGDLTRELPAGVALTVHRVVQEGLTNVLRHARDVGDVAVRIAHADDRVEVEVVDDGRPAGFTEGAGAGLLGLRERVALHGGEVRAERLPGRGFRLRAVVPVDAPGAAPPAPGAGSEAAAGAAGTTTGSGA